MATRDGKVDKQWPVDVFAYCLLAPSPLRVAEGAMDEWTSRTEERTRTRVQGSSSGKTS